MVVKTNTWQQFENTIIQNQMLAIGSAKMHFFCIGKRKKSKTKNFFVQCIIF